MNQRASSISSGSSTQGVAALGARDEAEHQRLRERPRLAADVADVGDPQPDLLGHLAGDGRLGGLPRLDEPGQDREPAGRPDRLPAEHHAVAAVVDEHDHGGVGAREELRAGRRVALHPAGPLDRRRRAGQRAEPVAARATPGSPMACTSSPASRSPRSAPTSRSPDHASTGRPLTVSERSPRTAAYGHAVGLAEVHRAGGQLGLLVPDQLRPVRPLGDRHGALARRR